ncbi:hypothetical protein HDE_10015 [Halotydeus destructor]|nr:hypothetical protein HDE_10015 [Halotydeus destructor]
MDCNSPDTKKQCEAEKASPSEEADCELCYTTIWAKKSEAEADSPSTPASAPGWMDDDEGYKPRVRPQSNYGRQNRQGYGGYSDYGNSNGYANGGHGNNGYGNNGYGNSYGNSYGSGYGNGYGNDGYGNGGYNGYGNDYGYNQYYGPPPQRYNNMGYGGGYKK